MLNLYVSNLFLLSIHHDVWNYNHLKSYPNKNKIKGLNCLPHTRYYLPSIHVPLQKNRVNMVPKSLIVQTDVQDLMEAVIFIQLLCIQR